MSAKRTRAPASRAALTVATNVNGDVTISLPGSMPSAWMAATSASVPLPTATACAVPTRSQKARSRRSTIGPWARWPDRTTSRTSASASGPSSTRLMGICGVVMGQTEWSMNSIRVPFRAYRRDVEEATISQLRIGVVGAGGMGANHARVIAESEVADLAMVVDRDTDRADDLGAPVRCPGCRRPIRSCAALRRSHRRGVDAVAPRSRAPAARSRHAHADRKAARGDRPPTQRSSSKRRRAPGYR